MSTTFDFPSETKRKNGNFFSPDRRENPFLLPLTKVNGNKKDLEGWQEYGNQKNPKRFAPRNYIEIASSYSYRNRNDTTTDKLQTKKRFFKKKRFYITNN